MAMPALPSMTASLGSYGTCAPFTCVSTAYRLVVPQM